MVYHPSPDMSVLFTEKSRVRTDGNGALALAGLQKTAIYILALPTEDGSLSPVVRPFTLNEDGTGLLYQ